jgi:hypothetical protein
LEDQAKLYKWYADSYGRKPSLFSKLIYGAEKLITGIYLKKWFFGLRWKGKHVNDLHLS